MLQVNLYVVFQSFDVENVVQTNLYELVVTLHVNEYIAVIRAFSMSVCGILRRLFHLKPCQCLVGRFEKLFVADRLQQVIQRIDPVAVQRILAECRCEDDACFGHYHL